MTWCSGSDDESSPSIHQLTKSNDASILHHPSPAVRCPSCGHQIQLQDQAGIHDLPGLPAGVKFDPTDQEILEHLEAKAISDVRKLHPLIDEFIPTLEGENGICYTHPQKLPGVSKDGQIRHFFPPTIKGLHDRNKKTAQSPHRRGRQRDTLAQNRENPTGIHRRRRQRFQENPRPLHQLRPPKKAGKNQLGHAPIPPRQQRGRERRRISRVQSFLPNPAPTMQLHRRRHQQQ